MFTFIFFLLAKNSSSLLYCLSFFLGFFCGFGFGFPFFVNVKYFMVCFKNTEFEAKAKERRMITLLWNLESSLVYRLFFDFLVSFFGWESKIE